MTEEECRAIQSSIFALKNLSAGDGNSMNTIAFFREAAGSGSQEICLPRIRFHAGCHWAATGLWFLLALVASGMVFSSTATGQEPSWQDSPRRQPSAVAQSYSDEELPSRAVVPDDETPRLTSPVPRKTVDSPSNQRTRRKNAEWSTSSDDGSQPARRTPPPPQHPVAVDEGNAPLAAEPFGNSDEGGEENDFGCCGPAYREILCNRLWFRGEALLWWVRGGQTPPLLTTSPASTPLATAGTIQPGVDTTVLFGNEELNTGLHAGGRMSFGLWLDRCEQSGVEFSYLILGQNTQTYSIASMGDPILARPYYDVSPGTLAGTTNGPTSLKIAYPNIFNGSFNAISAENFQGAEALWRQAIVHGCDGRIDLLAGYRFQRLTDGLTIADQVTGGTASAAAGTTFTQADLFHTRNDFNGGELGFATQWHRNRWSFDTLLKLGIGQTNTEVLINGWTTAIINGVTTTLSPAVCWHCRAIRGSTTRSSSPSCLKSGLPWAMI